MKDKAKIKRLEEKLKKILNNKMVKMWISFGLLPYKERESIKRQWNEYYKKSRDTKAYKRFAKMNQLAKDNKWKTVKEFAIKAKKQIENNEYEIKKPEGVDPEEMFRNTSVITYQNIKNYLKEQGNEMAEFL